MARTKYNHRQLIESYQPSPNKAIYPGMVIEFRYKAENIFDKKSYPYIFASTILY